MLIPNFDPLYWLVAGVAGLLALGAHVLVKSAYARYSREQTLRGISGAQAAAEILRRNGIRDVAIESVNGWLSDHYDPTCKTLRLSPDVYAGRSLAAVGIAAHEVGHALQHAQGYAFLGLRTAIVPAAQLGSSLAWPLIMFGGIFNLMGLMKLGVLLFGAVVLFQFVTLPVEINASSRAKAALRDCGILAHEGEAVGVSRVLDAAALTYVAAAIGTVLQLIYFLLRSGLLGGSRSDD